MLEQLRNPPAGKKNNYDVILNYIIMIIGGGIGGTSLHKILGCL